MFVRCASDFSDAGTVFDVDDVMYRKNVHRVLRTEAEIVRDADGTVFAKVASEVDGRKRGEFSAEEVDAVWEGYWLLRKLVLSFNWLSWRAKSLGVVLAETQGSSKYDTVYWLSYGSFCQAIVI